MPLTSRSLLLFCALVQAAGAFAQSVRLQEPWEAGYSGSDSNGAQVLAHWKFDGDQALKDLSGKGNDLTLQGAALAPAGRFGGALESFPGFPVQDKRHGAVTGPNPKLSPKGALTLEMWIQPKAEFEPKLRCYLLDKKYVDHTDYQWQIGDADKSGSRRMFVNLGFATESRSFFSQPFKLETGVWHHVAFTYDGSGTGAFYFDGQAQGKMTHAGFGPVSPGRKALSIGDRLGSNYGGFPGWIDEVRICDGVLSFEQVALQIAADRHVWRRMETAKPIEVNVTNLRGTPMVGGKLHLLMDARDEVIALPELAPGKSFNARFAVNTALKPASYSFRARLELAEPKPYATEQAMEVQITPRPAPQMPVVMWGAGGEEIPRLKDIGFTHFIGLGAQVDEIWKQKKPLPPGSPDYIERNRRYLDEALANGLSVVASLSPGHYLMSDPANLRVDRSGKPFARQDICASTPGFAEFFENVGRSVVQAYGDHPAFTTVLIDTEVRDGSQPSFNPVDVDNYRAFAGTEIPAEVASRSGVDWTKLKNFPADRVVADDDPILKYYRWFWTVGDGWNALHSALNKGVKRSGRRDLWTFFDPAVRQPSISGAGGQVDVLSHWTYTYPDPQRIGLCADQLFAMADASGRRQRVMKMTQLIWYRSQTAPIGAAKPGNVVAWEDHDPEAAYITIAPMHLREALWTKLARPVQGIMYHGWQSLVPTDSTGAYRYTNPNTVHVLKELLHDVVEPLGPALMSIPDERSEVALLESFTSQMFARRGGYGSNMSWATDVWLALQHAHVQTDVLFEETLMRKDGLSGRKVLVMPECDMLTRGVVERIREWQKKGGKIVADEFLCPGLKADVVLQSFKREKKAASDKARVLELAAKVAALDLPAKAKCDNPEIIVRTRRCGDATYVFVVNDRREAGTYVGQHGLVMENGLPASGAVSLAMEAGNVYDLKRGAMVVPQSGGAGQVGWHVDLGPCDGTVFMVVPKPLLGLQAELPETAIVGNTARLKVALTTTQDTPLKACVPVRVDVRDANGKPAEGCGWYAAENGQFTLDLDIATNEDPGYWEVRVRELASGMEAVKFVKVTR